MDTKIGLPRNGSKEYEREVNQLLRSLASVNEEEKKAKREWERQSNQLANSFKTKRSQAQHEHESKLNSARQRILAKEASEKAKLETQLNADITNRAHTLKSEKDAYQRRRSAHTASDAQTNAELDERYTALQEEEERKKKAAKRKGESAIVRITEEFTTEYDLRINEATQQFQTRARELKQQIALINKEEEQTKTSISEETKERLKVREREISKIRERSTNLNSQMTIMNALMQKHSTKSKPNPNKIRALFHSTQAAQDELNTIYNEMTDTYAIVKTLDERYSKLLFKLFDWALLGIILVVIAVVVVLKY